MHNIKVNKYFFDTSTNLIFANVIKAMLRVLREHIVISLINKCWDIGRSCYRISVRYSLCAMVYYSGKVEQGRSWWPKFALFVGMTAVRIHHNGKITKGKFKLLR